MSTANAHDHTQAQGDGQAPVAHVRVALIGAGFSGIGMAIGLQREGVRDFTVLERADDVGGVWRDNTYPGIACDIPSHLYSLSFALNPDWKRTFSDGDQIWTYLREVAERHGVLDRVHFGEEVLDASWDGAAQRWRIATPGRRLTADVLIDCAGPLTEPSIPALTGLERFEGTVFHSARWDHDHDLAGERVAVVGTGASAIQFVPEIQPRVGRLLVFQRTPGWVIPRMDRNVTELERHVLRTAPALARVLRASQFLVRDGLHYQMIRRQQVARRVAEAVSRTMIRLQVRDAGLRAQLTPDYEIGCKRVLISSDWYRALGQPNVEVVPGAVSEVRERSIVAADGREHPVDTIVFGTGFHVATAPIAERIRGADGRSLAAVWGGAPRLYRATEVAGFPNYFRLCGVGSGLGHGSMIWQLESQASYVLDALRTMRERGLTSVAVRQQAQDAYMEEIGRELRETVWMLGGCQSWYLDEGGEATVMWPRSMWACRRMTRRFAPADHHLRAASATASIVAAAA